MADGETKATLRMETAFGHGFLLDHWYFAALSREVGKGSLQRIEMLGEPVLIGRTRAGRAFALRDICPHRAAPLSAGRMVMYGSEGEAVECPYHGWRFRTADGICTSVPSLLADQDLDVERIRVRAYPVHEDQGLIFVYVAADPRDRPPADSPPRFEGVVGGAPKLVDRMDFHTHIDQAVVGLMDPTHGPYVHQQWWWRSKAKQLEKSKRFEPRPLGFAMIRHAPSSNSRAYRILGGAPETEISFRLPGYPAFVLLRPFIAAGARSFLRQDGDMVHLQNQGLKYDPPLIWIDDADRQAKWYQALKREWAKSRAEGRAFVNPVEPATLRWRS
jgi:phenylpropionate dioxygenase-like ring-hydroxylating dioxygenase large terminal subunit